MPSIEHNGDTFTASAMRKVKPGDYLMKSPTAAKVFIKGGYDRATDSFECCDAQSCNETVWIKASRVVYVGFTY